MIWIPITLLSALCMAMRAFYSKRVLNTDADEYAVSFGSRLLTGIILSPILLFISIPRLGLNFWLVLLASSAILTAATVFYMKAIKSEDISLTMPMVSFTPVFVLLLSPMVIKEIPNWYGIVGILLIVTGSYILNVKERKNGYLSPLKELFTNKGTFYMLLVALFWGFNATLDRLGVHNSSSILWLFSPYPVMSLFLLLIILFHNPKILKPLPKLLPRLIPLSLAGILETAFYLIAINYTYIAYVVSVKRFAIIISIAIGYLFLKEKDTKERLAGAFIMIVGLVLISIFN